MKILNLDNWCEEATSIIKEVAEVHTKVKDFTKYDGLITNLNPIDLRYYELGTVQFVASCTTGLDHIDFTGPFENVKIISLQGETNFLQDVWATAEHTWSLIMSLIRKVPWAFDDVKQGNWNREAWQGTELRGKTLGIVGYGRVGQQVAKIAEAFGMEVLKCDNKDISYFSDFERVLKNSDIITVHVPMTDKTYHLFNEKLFVEMKPTAYFINTSRGAVVNQDHLLKALLGKQIAGAAIDVMVGEPDAKHYLIPHSFFNKNLIITPHIAGNTAESRKKTQIFIADKIKEYIRWGELQNITLKEIDMFGSFSPTQWDCLTTDNKAIYIRFRHGNLTIKIEGQEQYFKEIDKDKLESGHSGEMTTNEMLQITGIKTTTDCKITEVDE